MLSGSGWMQHGSCLQAGTNRNLIHVLHGTSRTFQTTSKYIQDVVAVWTLQPNSQPVDHFWLRWIFAFGRLRPSLSGPQRSQKSNFTPENRRYSTPNCQLMLVNIPSRLTSHSWRTTNGCYWFRARFGWELLSALLCSNRKIESPKWPCAENVEWYQLVTKSSTSIEDHQAFSIFQP